MNKSIKILWLLFVAVFLWSGVAMATAMNANRPLTLGASSVPSEDSLQEIFDNHISNGSMDAYNDQSSAALWTPGEGIVDAYFITRFAGDAGVLGIYSATTGAEYDFSFSPSAPISFTINNTGGLFIAGVDTDPNFGNKFGFYWKDLNPSFLNRSYTEDSKNAGGYGPDSNILALTYLVPDGFEVLTQLYGGTTVTAKSNNDWILAFEDRIKGDGDFNDAVYYIEDLNAIPEPATMLLVGSGLIGLAGIGRRKFFKK